MGNDDKNKKLFSENLKYFLAINDKSRHDFSKDLGISYTTVCDWVKGNTVPRSQKVETIANYFGISVSELYEDHKHYNRPTKEEQLYKCINILVSDNYRKELLTKCTMLDLDNTKKVIDQVDYYLHKQDSSYDEFRWLDTYNDKYYDKEDYNSNYASDNSSNNHNN